MEGVSKYFPGVRALHEISFDVRPGEVHGLVGENGAGKSTLMGVASGQLVANAGTVTIAGQTVSGDPHLARDLGLAIVRQEPALMPDLTVAENLYLGLPEAKRPSLTGLNAWAQQLLRKWSDDVSINVKDQVALLNSEQRFIVEIVKALTCEPKVLVLDEPTEHLAADDVQRLFERVRQTAAGGAAVIYISHRIREVQAIANRITVLRDGEGQGTYDAETLSEDQIVSLIVGAQLDRTFPAKAGAEVGKVVLKVEKLNGPGFSNVSLEIRKGEILGLAGIDANGQREFIRALAGLLPSSGAVTIDGKAVTIKSQTDSKRSGITYLPGDRHREGIFADLSVRENFSLRSASDDLVGGIVRVSSEVERSNAAVRRFSVKTPTIETPIRSLSGGNQQKVVLASVLAASPTVLLVDEPTQGVDVGARAEIYKILRETAENGVAIILLSSDAQEVAGMSDRVAIFSRGNVVETLTAGAVSEDNITSAVLKSTSRRSTIGRRASPIWKWASGNAAPLVLVGLAILLLGSAVAFINPFYISPRSLGGMMTLIATLALVAYGQQLLMLVGGIDLSVGPLMGLSQVVASFFILQDLPLETQVWGWILVVAVAMALGAFNWFLVDLIKLHPMVATLSTFMAVQAVALLLRPIPAGMIDGAVLKSMGTRIGFVPLSFLAAIVVAVVLEAILYKRAVGLSLRGFGSRPEAARVAGISPRKMRLIAYVGCSTITAFAALTLMQQVGIGDARAGLNYTLTSIAATVIGGASLFGGRGSFLGAFLGAVFITQINAVTSFLGLDQAWQSYLLGGLILVAVALYSKSRQKVVAV